MPLLVHNPGGGTFSGGVQYGGGKKSKIGQNVFDTLTAINFFSLGRGGTWGGQYWGAWSFGTAQFRGEKLLQVTFLAVLSTKFVIGLTEYCSKKSARLTGEIEVNICNADLRHSIEHLADYFVFERKTLSVFLNPAKTGGFFTPNEWGSKRGREFCWPLADQILNWVAIPGSELTFM